MCVIAINIAVCCCCCCTAAAAAFIIVVIVVIIIVVVSVTSLKHMVTYLDPHYIVLRPVFYIK
jgi:hypothetical protein